MTPHNGHRSKIYWRPFDTAFASFSSALFALVFGIQIAQQPFPAPAAADAAGAGIAIAGAAATDDAKVSIVDFAFTPNEITVAVGASVIWSNDDGAPHGLAYKDGATGTDLLLPGAKFSRRFDRPGLYDYTCSVHPYMTGRVIVRPYP
jgi:plastocyanin